MEDKKKVKAKRNLEFKDIESKQQDITYLLFIPALQNACDESGQVSVWDTWLAQSVERVTLNLGVVSLSPTLGVEVA